MISVENPCDCVCSFLKMRAVGGGSVYIAPIVYYYDIAPIVIPGSG